VKKEYMPVYVITEVEAKRSLSLIFHRFYTQGVCYEVRRGKDSVASIMPVKRKKPGLTVGDLKRFFEGLPKLDHEDVLNFEGDVQRIRLES
jgi:hypothetical protein